MTTAAQPPATDDIESIARATGWGHLYDAYGAPGRVATHLRSQLAAADAEAQRRFPGGSVRLTADAVRTLDRQARHKARAFVEQLFYRHSPHMLVMVWRVLNGVDIGDVDLHLVAGHRFRLTVVLRPDRLGTEERYESDDVYDAALVRHFGVAKINDGLPYFLGFFPTWPAQS